MALVFIIFWKEHRLKILGFVALVCLVLFIRRNLLSKKPLLRRQGVTLSNQAKNSYAKDNSLGESELERSHREPRRIRGQRALYITRAPPPGANTACSIKPLVFYYTLGGSTKKYAQDLVAQLDEKITESEKVGPQILPSQLLDISHIELEDYFTSSPKFLDGIKPFYILLCPSYDIDTFLNNFIEHLRETHHDFRVDTGSLSDVAGYAVLGFGDKEGWPSESAGYCYQAKEIDKWMAKLTNRKRAYPLGFVDSKAAGKASVVEWGRGLFQIFLDIRELGVLGDGVPGSGDAVESDNDDDEADDGMSYNPGEKPKSGKSKYKLTGDDIENLNYSAASHDGWPEPTDFTKKVGKTSVRNEESMQRREMVPITSPTHAALSKQGYTIIGSHSGVKICRWTKSALRGRGSCYKKSFYGIQSHLCMEATPSLACANKCVFCWRHGTNPVGTTWRWEVDPPEKIFQGIKSGHYKKIKMLRGVPGVRADRFEDAMRIRHCALSLVGEPIFYPHINQLLAMLHAEHISSFLVCNAQHPEQLSKLQKVTQLYVSIDASNKDSLRKIDRPLHRDFWERFCACLDILREKRFVQRTVFRLTLVKGFNIEDAVEGYTKLVERGLPCFIEVKGVTYCGTSSSAGAGLSMQNVPFYEEVVAFVQALNKALSDKGLEYGLAAEHAHSCCVLLASRRFFIDGTWWTRIDYERFFELLDSKREFTPEDYVMKTEQWALWGNGGFDPADERMKTKGKNKTTVPSSK